MDKTLTEWLDDAIRQSESHHFASPEAGLRFPLATIRWLRGQAADLEEKLAEYENDEVARRRHIVHLERLNDRLHEHLLQCQEQNLNYFALAQAREDQGE